MHPEDIKAELRKRRVTQARIARELKVSKQAVSNTILGRTRSGRIEKYIAEQLGLELWDVFPRFYRPVQKTGA